MKRTYNLFTAIIFFTFVFSGVGRSQDLQEVLNNLTGSSAKAYLSPVISGFGANLNSGWVHKSPSSKLFGLDLEVGVVFMGTMLNDKDKSFVSSGTFKFSNEKALILINNSDQTRNLPQSYKDGLANEIAQKEFTVGISGPTIVGSKDSEVMVNFSETEV